MYNAVIEGNKPLREIVYEELKKRILTDLIKPGMRMMEVELADEMGVSRTPVREAIRKLEKEGLVTIRPGKGAYASLMSVKRMMDILEVRSNLEGLAACLAAKRMQDKAKASLRQVLEQFEDALLKGDMRAMIETDSRFHRMIVDASDNSHLIALVEQLQELVLRFRYIYYKDFKRAKEMVPEHRCIYEAILNKDAKRASKAAFNHIDRLKDMILKDDLK